MNMTTKKEAIVQLNNRVHYIALRALIVKNMQERGNKNIDQMH